MCPCRLTGCHVLVLFCSVFPGLFYFVICFQFGSMGSVFLSSSAGFGFHPDAPVSPAIQKQFSRFQSEPIFRNHIVVLNISHVSTQFKTLQVQNVLYNMSSHFGLHVHCVIEKDNSRFCQTILSLFTSSKSESKLRFPFPLDKLYVCLHFGLPKVCP